MVLFGLKKRVLLAEAEGEEGLGLHIVVVLLIITIIVATQYNVDTLKEKFEFWVLQHLMGGNNTCLVCVYIHKNRVLFHQYVSRFWQSRKMLPKCGYRFSFREGNNITNFMHLH